MPKILLSEALAERLEDLDEDGIERFEARIDAMFKRHPSTEQLVLSYSPYDLKQSDVRYVSYATAPR